MVVELPRTSRLRFRRVRPDDAERFDRLDRDEEVMRFIDWKPPTLAEQRQAVADFIADCERWPDHGRFVAESPAGEFLGWFGRWVHTDPRVPDLGYRLHRRIWGRGLATEGSLALIDYAFTQLHARAVQAETMLVNQASRRVMENPKASISAVRPRATPAPSTIPIAEATTPSNSASVRGCAAPATG